LSFTRDYAPAGAAGNPTVVVGPGLRGSARAFSSTNFTTSAFMARETSANSINLPNEPNQIPTSLQNNSNTQSVILLFLILKSFIFNTIFDLVE